jgi:hypothetical protein
MIKGFSEPKRITRVGKIYLGMKKENSQGKEYPTATDYFFVRADGVNTSQAAAEAFYNVYGSEPKEITVAFPSDDPENFMPQYLASYRGGGGRHELYCKGDGENAGRADGNGGITNISCLYRDCPIYIEGKCKELTRLLFLLPEVEGIGVWELDTTSYHSAQNLVSSVELIRKLTRGRIAMIPLKLRVVPKVVNPDGRTKTVFILDLKLENIRLIDLLNRIPQLGAEDPMQLVEPINHNEMPDDLYVESNVVTDVEPPKVVSDIRVNNDETLPVPEKIAVFIERKWFQDNAGNYCAAIRLADPKGNIVAGVTNETQLLTLLKHAKEGDLFRYEATNDEEGRVIFTRMVKSAS